MLRGLRLGDVGRKAGECRQDRSTEGDVLVGCGQPRSAEELFEIKGDVSGVVATHAAPLEAFEVEHVEVLGVGAFVEPADGAFTARAVLEVVIG